MDRFREGTDNFVFAKILRPPLGLIQLLPIEHPRIVLVRYKSEQVASYMYFGGAHFDFRL
jgi:hypothetical protein